MEQREFTKKMKELFPVIKIDHDKNFVIYTLKEGSQQYCFCVWKDDIKENYDDLLRRCAREYTEDYKLYIAGALADYGMFS